MTEDYQRHHEADEKIDSAIKVIEALLALEIHLPMKRRFLSNCLWKITEAEGKGKYKLRYRSKKSLNLPREELRHDHVYRRKVMVDALLQRPKEADIIVRNAVGCVVTKEEHANLAKEDKKSGDIDGWQRYRKAGIEVLDMEEGRPMDFG